MGPQSSARLYPWSSKASWLSCLGSSRFSSNPTLKNCAEETRKMTQQIRCLLHEDLCTSAHGGVHLKLGAGEFPVEF